MSLCLFIASQFWQYVPFALFLPMENVPFPFMKFWFIILAWLSVIIS